MSSFAGADYFASGPHAFAVGPRGKQWIRPVDLGSATAGIQVLGDHALTVEVNGRLTASSHAALATLADALEAAAGTKGDLTDDTGRTWTALRLLDVAYDGPPQTGRTVSIGYRALFADA